MSLILKNDTNNILGRLYNVEYELGNGKIQTLSNILENVDGVYFWFSSKENGLDIIRQDRIITMVCIRDFINPWQKINIIVYLVY